MNNTIKIAYHILTQKFIHIDNASNGLSCNCECLKCKEKLEAIQGEIRTKHFRHSINKNCQGSQETALHELAKQILVDNSKITIPNIGLITYYESVAERQIENKRPDVSATFDGEKIYFEIYVSHVVDKDKERFFITGKHKSVEIDLSNYLTSTFDEIKNAILNKTENKRVIYWADEKQSETLRNENFDWIKYLIGIIALFGICRYLTNKKHKRRIKNRYKK